ncbi:hypothetical protein T492DRAFT_117899 [Pavlovales sp. CCMP2436]|nr:hypothetical protein T492DRAFT_117899 [Pavlovales sp. CCMP2436]
MRVLVVVCTSNAKGTEQLGCSLNALVRELLGPFSIVGAHTQLDVRVRSHRQLDELVPPRAVPVSRNNADQFDRIKRIDAYDLVFLYATPEFAPWAEAAQEVRWFVRNAFITRKCLFAWGGGMQLLAYVLGTGGNLAATPMRSTNGAPLRTLPPPSARLPAHWPLIDAVTGEVLAWDAIRAEWVAILDAGSHLNSAHPDAPYCRVDERGLAKEPDCRQLTVRVPHAQATHQLVTALGGPSAQVQTRNRWSCHLRGDFGGVGVLRELLTHPHGSQAFEVGNCVAVQFELSASYPASLALARRFAERSMATLARARTSELLSASASRAPVPLAYVVGQSKIDAVPSSLLDIVAALAPDSDRALTAFHSARLDSNFTASEASALATLAALVAARYPRAPTEQSLLRGEYSVIPNQHGSKLASSASVIRRSVASDLGQRSGSTIGLSASTLASAARPANKKPRPSSARPAREIVERVRNAAESSRCSKRLGRSRMRACLSAPPRAGGRRCTECRARTMRPTIFSSSRRTQT